MRPHKYGAKSCVIDNHKFPSLSEGRRYSELKILERAGKIRNLELQVRFPLRVEGKLICTAVWDFKYFEGNNTVIEERKGFRTAVYKIKRKLFEALYPGHTFIETRAK